MAVRGYPQTTRQARLLGVVALLAGVGLTSVEHSLAIVAGLLVILVGLVVVRYAAFVAGRTDKLAGE